MSLVFDHANHQYWLDGELVPSVTQILRDSGLIKLDGIPAFILEAARNRGAAVHALVHYLNENDLDWESVDPAYKGYLDAWVRYREEKRLRIHLCEYRVASRLRRLAGTFDVLGEIEEEGIPTGDGVLIDVKTGEPEDVAADLQLGGYDGLMREWAKEDPRLAEALARFKRIHRIAVRLRRTGLFKAHPYHDPRDTAEFYALGVAWHIRARRGALVLPDDVAA